MYTLYVCLLGVREMLHSVTGSLYACILQREIYNDFIVSIRDNLKSRGIVDRVEYFGSRYKGTAIDSSDYDNLFVKRDQTIMVQPSPSYPNFVYLTMSYGQKINKSDRLKMFRAEMQQSLRNVGASSFAQIANAYGPTVVLSYRKAQLSFSVDTVYGLEVGGQIYIGKPSPDDMDDDFLWYKDVAKEEKEKMINIDFDNGIGKMVLRRLKKLKDIEPTLQQLKSCAFEQALMYLKDQYTDVVFWRENNMLEILKALLLFMEAALRNGTLPVYFDRNDDVIRGLTPDKKNQLANRFRNLAKNPAIVIQKTN